MVAMVTPSRRSYILPVPFFFFIFSHVKEGEDDRGITDALSSI